ncbi:Pyridine nucleotide disulphide reductase class-I [Acididesulfobacillus acetoxydans]|uniref:NADH-dependent phenylglyoxylate dehydrogenase subunit epsilon n=1 Tax=Acididesulfobacillus acetoxydans TaxID=1561005 RepID=A0A8S0W288_9FIRM|nr:FAD-dependent oxidoreductase [Acididesulfobacillus acetoxydans]CAA7600508.1 Pyridine nucleotide disulphide reductase class-I [Acididesulfobacillus acetoxydans]CEJ06642.1 NADH-dependent phenylglyoxylate dehydrogenase subunit epsilon [Acididesulfobacillus acetoxydans]
MNYVLVGNSAASLFAAEAIRQQDTRSEITVLTADTYPFYSRCLTTYFLAGDISQSQLALRHVHTLQALQLTVHYHCPVTGLEPRKRVLFTAAGEYYRYDKCLIATGASAVSLPVPGSNLPEVFTLRHLEDALRIKKHLEPNRRAVIIGGGLVSLKSAYALLKQGLRVTVIISSGQILSQMLNPEAADLLQAHLTSHGLTFQFNQDVGAIEGSEHVHSVHLRNGETLPADIVIVGKGVLPNTQPFSSSGLAIRKGIPVNEHLETNLADVYAAGDVAEAWDRIHQIQRLNPIWPNATTQGRIAGANMAGHHLTYSGSMGMNAVDFFGLRIISAGMIRPPSAPPWHHKDTLSRSTTGHPHYQRLVWKNDELKGFVLVGNTERAGVLTALIQSERPLSQTVQQELQNGKRSRVF